MKMKNENTGQKNNLQRFSFLMCIVIIMFLGVGCKKQASYDVEDYRTKEDESLYCFTESIADMENIVAVAQYNEEQILLYCEDLEEKNLHKKIWLFSYLTGEKTLCSDFVVEAEDDYYMTRDRYAVLSADPFVIEDIFSNEIHIYTEDLSGYSTISVGDFCMPSRMYVRNGNLYFMDFLNGKVYCHELGEYKSETRKTDYESFREESQIVYTPDYKLGYCALDAVSEDGDYLSIYGENLRDGKYYYYIYNVQEQAYEERFWFEDEPGALWKSWDYEKMFAAVEPSAVARYEMVDYEEEKTYTTVIEPEAVYSYVDCDLNISKQQNKILFYSVDEHSELITELFLWDYTKAESDEADEEPKKIQTLTPRETYYEDLTEWAERLEEKFGVNIIMGENVDCEFDAYEYETVTDTRHISYALDELELALDAFPDGMFEEITSDYAMGFNIYLCGRFTPKNDENISDAGAFFVFDNGYYNVAVDIMQGCTENNLIHEITHALDQYFVHCEVAGELEKMWTACNPEGFTYLESYFEYEDQYEYTYFDTYEDINEVYFCDMYSKTFPGEDRSRVFEYFGSEYYREEWVLQSESLRRKARVLLDFCTENLECFRADKEYGLKTKAEELGW